jgi:hypothetical protein
MCLTFVVLLIIVGGYLLSIVFALIPMLKFGSVAALALIAVLTLSAFLVLFWLRQASSMDPGSVPLDWKPNDEDRRQYRLIPRRKVNSANHNTEKDRWCKKCEIFKVTTLCLCSCVRVALTVCCSQREHITATSAIDAA